MLSITPLPRIIGVGGLARSGKDTFAEALRRVSPTPWTTFAFANAVRRTAAAAYNVDPDEFTDSALKDNLHPTWGITRRRMLNIIGEALRREDPDHWVKHFLRPPVDAESKPLYSVIVTDVRRLNEAALIHDLGGVTVLVRRRGVMWNGHHTEALAKLALDCTAEGAPLTYGDARFERLVARMADGDASAAGYGTWFDAMSGTWRQHTGRVVFDHIIDNDGTVADLHDKAAALLSYINRGII